MEIPGWFLKTGQSETQLYLVLEGKGNTMTKKTKIDIETLEKAFSRIVKLPGRELDKIRVYETTTSIDILKIGITKLQGIKISLLALIIIVIIIVVVGTIFLIG